MIRRFFSRLRNRDGQALVLCAIVFPLVLLFLAFVVDTAHAFVDQRHLQNTADAASLAAAQQLNGGSPGCSSLADCATQYVSYNSGPTISGGTLQPCKDSSGNPITTYITQDMVDQQLKNEGGCYQSPYAYDPSKPTPPDCSAATGTCADRVVVWLYECNPTFFGGILGISRVCVSVHSVSQGSTSPVTQTVVTPGSTTPPSTVTNTSTGTTVIHGTTGLFTTTITTTIPATTIGASTVFVTNTVTSPFTTTNTNAGLPTALFAKDTSCAGLGITIDKTGNSDAIVGAAISNGKINIQGNSGPGGTSIGFANYGGPNICTITGGSKVVVQPPSTHSDTKDWPLTYVRSTICNGHDQPGAFTVTSSTPSGVYCSPVSINIDNHAAKDLNLTLVAPVITVDANWPGSNILPATGQTLTIWQTGTSPPPTDFTFAPNNACLGGVVWIETGTFTYSGNSACVGFYQAQDIEVTGNQVNINGNGPTVCCVTTTITTSTVQTNTVTNTVGFTNTTVTTVFNTSTGSTTSPDSTSTSATTNTITYPGTQVGPVTNTSTVGTSTNLKLKQ